MNTWFSSLLYQLVILKKRLYQTLLSTFSQPIFVYPLDWSLDGTSSLAGEWKIGLLKSARQPLAKVIIIMTLMLLFLRKANRKRMLLSEFVAIFMHVF